MRRAGGDHAGSEHAALRVRVCRGAALGGGRAAPALAATGGHAHRALADGSTARQFFAGTGAAIEVPLAALHAGSGSLRNAALRYLGPGIEHILLGVDHLLFVLGLLLSIGSRSPRCSA